jgi:hypothetical protein
MHPSPCRPITFCYLLVVMPYAHAVVDLGSFVSIVMQVQMLDFYLPCHCGCCWLRECCGKWVDWDVLMNSSKIGLNGRE